MDIEGFGKNPPNRCYLCKRENIKTIAEGSNLDDDGDDRPGLQAVAEFGIKSSLRNSGMSKADIRILSKTMGLATWNKQSFACLSSRFAYGETISREKLSMVGSCGTVAFGSWISSSACTNS